jgi:hypothetical protein
METLWWYILVGLACAGWGYDRGLRHGWKKGKDEMYDAITFHAEPRRSPGAAGGDT